MLPSPVQGRDSSQNLQRLDHLWELTNKFEILVKLNGKVLVMGRFELCVLLGKWSKGAETVELNTRNFGNDFNTRNKGGPHFLISPNLLPAVLQSAVATGRKTAYATFAHSVKPVLTSQASEEYGSDLHTTLNIHVHTHTVKVRHFFPVLENMFPVLDYCCIRTRNF